jgi:hypothetical protein
VVLCRSGVYLSQAKIALKIPELIQNHAFNMISAISCNITANHRDIISQSQGVILEGLSAMPLRDAIHWKLGHE